MSSRSAKFSRWLDILAIFAWGALLLKFWLTQQISILLHPDYVWLAYSAGFVLLGLGLLKLAPIVWRSLTNTNRRRQRQKAKAAEPVIPHISLFPPMLSSAMLLVVALFGFVFTPQPFASQVALDRGVTETLTLTRSQPQSFSGKSRPENRSLVDWVRLLNVYPEPDAYMGQKVNADGFVIRPPDLPANYILLARFIITCCAADAYPVGFPVKLKAGEAAKYQADTWFKVEGKMITETLKGKRQLVIEASGLKEIPKPANPYGA
jgi:uncharacterized repeat protein (TIGR03943 family)